MSLETKQSLQFHTETKFPENEDMSLDLSDTFASLNNSELCTPVFIEANDNKVFKTNVNNILISDILKNIIIQGDELVLENTRIKLTRSSVALKYVVEYLNHQNGVDAEEIERPITTIHHKDVCKTEWHANFIQSMYDDSVDTILDVFNTANYLNIPGLMSYVGSFIASKIKGRTNDENLKIWGFMI